MPPEEENVNKSPEMIEREKRKARAVEIILLLEGRSYFEACCILDEVVCLLKDKSFVKCGQTV